MSDETQLVEVMKQQAIGLQQNAAVNAASIAQREKHAEAERVSRDKGTQLHCLVNALNFAVRLNSSHDDRTADNVLEDADKFLAWLTKDHTA